MFGIKHGFLGKPGKATKAAFLQPYKALNMFSRNPKKAFESGAFLPPGSPLKNNFSGNAPPISSAPVSSPSSTPVAPPMRDFSKLTGGQLTPEELAREGQKVLAGDRAKFSSMNYPTYTGQTVSPMSTLTQRAQGLTNRFASSPRPYSAKINTVLGRSGEGITPQNVQGLLNTVAGEQGAFGQNVLLQTLQNQFGNNYAPRAQQFTADTTRDVNEYLPEAQGNLNNLARISSGLEGSRNVQTVKALQKLQGNREAQRGALINNLQQFGAQRHAHNNMVNSAAQNQFRQEFNAPYERMDMLERSLSPYGGLGEGQQIHPDLERANAAQILQALKAYGVDTSRPASEWGNTSPVNTPQYKGQLVANLPEEILRSGEILERLRPNLTDENTEARRGLTRELVENPTISGRALQNLPGAMQGRLGQMDKQAREAMQRSLGAINNKYIKLGQFNSPMHMNEVEEVSKRLNQAMTEQRSLETQNALRDQLQLGHSEEINRLNRLNQIGEQNHNDYADILNRIRGMNQIGADRFANEQGENERLYKNFQESRLWEWPHMRSAIRREGLAEGNAQGVAQGRGLGGQEARNEIFNGLATRGINLDQLARLNTQYSDLDRVNRTLRQDLTSSQQSYNALQQQVNAQRAQEQQRQQAEAQRQYAQAEAQRQAQVQAEIQRLGGLENKDRLESRFNALGSNLNSLNLGYRNVPAERQAQLRDQYQRDFNELRNIHAQLRWPESSFAWGTNPRPWG